MFGIELNDTVVVEQRAALERALTTNQKTQAALRKIIRSALDPARTSVVAAARRSMHSDPRGTANYVHASVYKKMLGGNLNIYPSRKRSPREYVPPSQGARPGQRGGNRAPVSARTLYVRRMLGPEILEWVNGGTGDRVAGTRTMKFEGANRGRIALRNWFMPAAQSALMQASETIARQIDEEFGKIFKK